MFISAGPPFFHSDPFHVPPFHSLLIFEQFEQVGIALLRQRELPVLKPSGAPANQLKPASTRARGLSARRDRCSRAARRRSGGLSAKSRSPTASSEFFRGEARKPRRVMRSKRSYDEAACPRPRPDSSWYAVGGLAQATAKRSSRSTARRARARSARAGSATRVAGAMYRAASPSGSAPATRSRDRASGRR